MRQMVSMRPLFKTLEFFGFKYLGLSKNPTLPLQRFNYSAWYGSLKYAMIYGLMLTATMIGNVKYLYPNIPLMLVINNVGTTTVYSINLLLMIVIPRFFLYDDMPQLFRYFEQVDVVLNLQPSYFHHCTKSSWLLIVLYGISIPSLLVIIVVVGYGAFGPAIALHGYIGMNIAIQEFPLAILLYFTIVIYERFRLVNEFLPLVTTEKVYKVKSLTFFNYMYPELKRNATKIYGDITVQQLCKCHDKLVDICELVNEVFGYIILLRTLGALGACCYGFNFYFNIVSNPNFTPVNQTIGSYFPQVMLITFAAMTIYTYSLSFCCVLAAKEGNKTELVISEILSRNEATPESVDYLRMYLEFARARPVEFTQAGMSKVDSQLIWQFLSSVITVILLIKQFM